MWVGAGSKPLTQQISVEHLLGAKTPANGSTGWVVGATRNPGGQTWGRGCGQGCPSGGGGGRTTSHHGPVGSTGRHPEVGWRGAPVGHLGETRRRGRKGDGHAAETQGQRPGGRSCPHPCRGLGTGVGPAWSAQGRPWRRKPGTSCGRSTQVHPGQGKAGVLCWKDGSEESPG